MKRISKEKKEKPECYIKYVELQKFGLTPTYFANVLNDRGLRRKTNSPYIAQTVTYTVNGHQMDTHIVDVINEEYANRFSKKPLQNA